MDAFNTWFAFLCAELIDRCTARIKLECQGCKKGLLSPLLHYHSHFNLQETLKEKKQVVSLEMDIQKLYNSFLVKFGLFDLPEDEYIKIGQCFVRFSSADAIYYGNYITKDNEKLIYEAPNEPEYKPTPIIGVKRKKIAISEDDFSGTDLTS